MSLIRLFSYWHIVSKPRNLYVNFLFVLSFFFVFLNCRFNNKLFASVCIFILNCIIDVVMGGVKKHWGRAQGDNRCTWWVQLQTHTITTLSHTTQTISLQNFIINPLLISFSPLSFFFHFFFYIFRENELYKLRTFIEIFWVVLKAKS